MPLIEPALRPMRREPTSFLRKVGNAGLTALGYAGNVLDLPGSSIRDIISGQNPFDQWASPLSSNNRMSGRDVMQHYGLVGQNQEGLDSSDVAGFLGEMALDPLTYFGGIGLLKHAGRGGDLSNAARTMSVAKKAGKVPSIRPSMTRHPRKTPLRNQNLWDEHAEEMFSGIHRPNGNVNFSPTPSDISPLRGKAPIEEIEKYHKMKSMVLNKSKERDDLRNFADGIIDRNDGGDLLDPFPVGEIANHARTRAANLEMDENIIRGMIDNVDTKYLRNTGGAGLALAGTAYGSNQMRNEEPENIFKRLSSIKKGR